MLDCLEETQNYIDGLVQDWSISIANHYSDVIMGAMASQITSVSIVWWEFTGHRWIPLTRASDADLWRFLWSAPE